MNYHFVTGSSQGIGLAITKALLRRDPSNRVTGISRQQNVTDDRYVHLPVNLADGAELAAFRFPTVEDAQRIVLINNAGTLGTIDHLGRLDNAELVRNFTLNLAAPTALVNAFVEAYQHLPAKKLVIMLSSGAATKPYDGWGPYCSAKAGLEMLARVAHQEQLVSEHDFPIEFKSISPGPVRTAMQKQIREAGEAAFSQVSRFRQLASTDALPSPESVADKFVEVIENPAAFPEVIHRFG